MIFEIKVGTSWILQFYKKLIAIKFALLKCGYETSSSRFLEKCISLYFWIISLQADVCSYAFDNKWYLKIKKELKNFSLFLKCFFFILRFMIDCIQTWFIIRMWPYSEATTNFRFEKNESRLSRFRSLNRSNSNSL